MRGDPEPIEELDEGIEDVEVEPMTAALAVIDDDESEEEVCEDGISVPEIRRRLFVSHLLNSPSLNAAEAARRAGYSAENARRIGFRLLKNPDVSAAIRKRVGERMRRLEINADQLLVHLLEMATLDVGEIAAVTSAADIQALPERVRRVLGSVTFTEKSGDNYSESTVKLDVPNKLGAVVQIAKMLELVADGPESRLAPEGGQEVRIVIVPAKEPRATNLEVVIEHEANGGS